jgi:hypothetical protein
MCYWFGMMQEKESPLLRLACTAPCFSRLTWSWPAFLVAVPTTSCIILTQPRRYLLLALSCLSFAFWLSQSTETRRGKTQPQHLTTNLPALGTLLFILHDALHSSCLSPPRHDETTYSHKIQHLINQPWGHSCSYSMMLCILAILIRKDRQNTATKSTANPVHITSPRPSATPPPADPPTHAFHRP